MSEPDRAHGSPGLIDRGQASFQRLVDQGQRTYERIAGIRRVALGLRTMDQFNAAGGGLTAGGLAYSTLFTLTAVFLCIVGVAGIVIADQAARDALVDELASAFPPLEPIIRPALEGIAQGAVPITIISFVGALWGLNGLFAALESSFSRVFGSARRRDPIGNRLWALGLVIVFGLSVAAIAIVAGAANVDGLTNQILKLVLGPIGLSLAIGFLYRFIPTSRPSWRAIAGPAIIVGTLIALWTSVFGIIAPMLFRWLAIYGPLATVLAALIWLQYLFQMLLLGGGWVAVRAEDETLPVTQESPDGHGVVPPVDDTRGPSDEAPPVDSGPGPDDEGALS